MLSSRTGTWNKGEILKLFHTTVSFLISVTNAVLLRTKNSDQSNRGWMTPVQVVGCCFAEKPILDCNQVVLYLQFCSGGESRGGIGYLILYQNPEAMRNCLTEEIGEWAGDGVLAVAYKPFILLCSRRVTGCSACTH